MIIQPDYFLDTNTVNTGFVFFLNTYTHKTSWDWDRDRLYTKKGFVQKFLNLKPMPIFLDEDI